MGADTFTIDDLRGLAPDAAVELTEASDARIAVELDLFLRRNPLLAEEAAQVWLDVRAAEPHRQREFLIAAAVIMARRPAVAR